jgi:hypothetical protein
VKPFLRPVESCLSHVVGQLVMLFLFGFFLFEGCTTSLSYGSYGPPSYQQLRVIMMPVNEASGEKLSVLSSLSSVGVLQLLHAGCAIESFNISGFMPSTYGYSTAPINPRTRWQADGFALNVSLTTGIILVLEGSNSDGIWSFIGQASDFRKVSSGVRFFGGRKNMEWMQHAFDLRAPWPLLLTSSATSITFACGFAGLALLRCFGHAHRARPFLCLVILALLSINLVAGAGFLHLGLSRETFYPLWIVGVCILLGSVLWLAETFFFESAVGLSALACFGRYVEDCWIFDDCSCLSREPPIGWMMLCVAGVHVLIWRTRLFFRLTAVEPDRAFNDAQWRQIAESEGAVSAIERIGALSARVTAACSAQLREARHYNRARRPDPPAPACGTPVAATAPPEQTAPPAPPAPGPAHGYELIDSHKNTVPGSADRRRPVSSLGQLYAQALVASLELCERATAWAAESQGRLSHGGPPAAAVPGPGLGPDPEDACLELLPPVTQDLVRCGLIKHPLRATLKAAACYGGDVSRLADVCRARILFDDAGGLAACAERVCADPAVRVVRVKDGMGGADEAGLSIGFRVTHPAPLNSLSALLLLVTHPTLLTRAPSRHRPDEREGARA